MLFVNCQTNKLGLILSIFKSKTHVQTARESHDLNMDFHSFDNGFKQLCKNNESITTNHRFRTDNRQSHWGTNINFTGQIFVLDSGVVKRNNSFD